MDARKVIGTSCLGDPIYETDKDLVMTEAEERQAAIAAGLFDVVVVGFAGSEYVASDEPGLYHPLLEDGMPDFSKKESLPI